MWVVIERRMKGEGGGEIQWRDRSNRERLPRLVFHRSTIKLARGDSPRKFSIFFSEPTFPEIEIGEQRTSHDIEKVPFSSLVNFQIDPQTLNSIKSLSTDPTTFDKIRIVAIRNVHGRTTSASRFEEQVKEAKRPVRVSSYPRRRAF